MSYIKIVNFLPCVILLSITFDVVQSRFVYKPDIQREINQDKVVATWQEAKEHCESQGAILASPIDSAHFNYMRSYIEVNDHTSAYFTGYKAVMHDDDLNYISVEGIFLDELPDAVVNMIEKIDPEDGNCLSMDRREIRAVPCWERLPYICYTKVTNEKSFVPVDMYVTPDVSIEISSSEPAEIATEPVDVITKLIPEAPIELSSSEQVDGSVKVTTDISMEASSIVPVDIITERIRDVSIEVSSTEPAAMTTERVEVTTDDDDLIKSILSMSEETPSDLPDEPEEATEAAIDVRMNNADEEEHVGSGYSYYDTGSLYKLHDAPVPWTNANATCAREGGYLAVINDDAEARVLAELGDIYPHVVWIGLKKEHGDWRSVQDDSLEAIFNKWTIIRANYECGVIMSTGVLDDRDCDYPLPFICEKNVVPIDAEVY